jgi:hypothetical protein
MTDGNRKGGSLARGTSLGAKSAVVMLALALALAGCAGSVGDAASPGSDAGGGAGSDCAVSLRFDPPAPVAGPTTTIRVSSFVSHAPGVLDYSWRVEFGGTPVEVRVAQADHSAIDVAAPVPGVYTVHLDILGSLDYCSSASGVINVRAPGAQSERFRLRVVPPQSVAAPPLEKGLVIDGGASADLGIVGLDRGTPVTVLVSGPSGGVPAYLRFAPSGVPDAIVEGFADGSGHAAVQLLSQAYTVLVVPAAAGLAPRRIASWSPSSGALRVDAGATITGTVLDPAGAPLAGAIIQLSIDGVPSTVAATGSDGRFAVHAVTVAQAAVTVEVTPQPASGLPRLSAASQAFDLGVPLQIGYAPSLSLKDLAGTRVQRQGTPVAGAKLMMVGALADAGTVTAGTSVNATGNVRISASADATGALTSVRVPAAGLSAVITVTAGDLAVVALDTTAGVPADLDAPAMPSITATMLGPTAAGLAGAVLDLVPAGALAMASAPTLHVTAGPAGKVTATLASGGHYDVRLHDPAGRAAPLAVADRVAATIDRTTYQLPAALAIHGQLMIGGTQALANASVQILCDACTGIDREKPIAEVASDETGQFTLAVPDPGTM